jgi:hypothetical protein
MARAWRLTRSKTPRALRFGRAAWLLVACAFACASLPAGAATLTIAANSTLQLDGSSNVAPWRCTGRTLSGVMSVETTMGRINEVIDHIEDGAVGVWMRNPAAGRFPPPRFEVEIPVETLRCSGGRPMESDLRRALQGERHPVIRFRFREVRAGIEHDIDRNLYRAVVVGELSLAGTVRDVVLQVEAERISPALFRLQASLPLKMSSFGIVPPKAFFGMLRAADELRVEFSLYLQP